MDYISFNPATEVLIQRYPCLTDTEALACVEQSHQAFLQWKKTSFEQRKQLVLTLARLLRERKKDYARLMAEEMGKPVAQGEIEIDKCARGCEYYAQEAETFLQPEMIRSEAQRSYVRHDPLGVILGIMPWNFPFWQVFRFSIPALMAGNAVLLKHAPNVPRSALTIASLFEEAGFPKNIFQALFLSNETAVVVIESPFVGSVSLTGSDRAGSQVASTAGRSLKKTVLELGGSDPFIVFEDADLEKTIPFAVQSRMNNAGQSCIAAKRFIVMEKIFPEFEKRLSAALQKLKIGDPLQAETDIGPLAREDLLLNLDRQVKESIAQGAQLLLGGKRRSGKGYFYEPTLLTNVKPGMVVFQEEVFGPVACLAKVTTQEEAVRLANQTSYGLGASLWTRNIPLAESLAEDIEAGSVFINGMVKSDPRLPFGGVKRSGYGRELSLIGIREFTNIKTVWIG